MVKIYHFTKKENLDNIFTQGLIPGTKFLTLGSRLREGALYFYISPEDDAMGYLGNDDYECLEVSVDPGICVVVNMDIISAAYVNFKMAKEKNELHDFKDLVRIYDTTAIPYLSYERGSFRTPEVIVREIIQPQNIRPAGLKKVAVHDEPTGLLHSYLMGDKFFTVKAKPC